MLWVELFGIYYAGECGLISAVEVGDGARHWKCLKVLGVIEEIKSPRGDRGL